LAIPVKRSIAAAVVGILALLAVISLIVQFDSSGSYAKAFGGAAFAAAVIFYALGWVKLNKE